MNFRRKGKGEKGKRRTASFIGEKNQLLGHGFKQGNRICDACDESRCAGQRNRN